MKVSLNGGNLFGFPLQTPGCPRGRGTTPSASATALAIGFSRLKSTQPTIRCKAALRSAAY
ncbi:hypothetical protein BDD14_1796 [Edaphobacter modestus]|uniref:Uncharacterized protein n=1 Tax=Edaphobacter modestus TaxID=388466 RepID=A0A4Q7YTV2_9BACT|nr:hypothetical protein BDD14_1796 [Edaphobacter modestus]